MPKFARFESLKGDIFASIPTLHPSVIHLHRIDVRMTVCMRVPLTLVIAFLTETRPSIHDMQVLVIKVHIGFLPILPVRVENLLTVVNHFKLLVIEHWRQRVERITEELVKPGGIFVQIDKDEAVGLFVSGPCSLRMASRHRTGMGLPRDLLSTGGMLVPRETPLPPRRRWCPPSARLGFATNQAALRDSLTQRRKPGT